MVVCGEFLKDRPQVPFPERNGAVQAFLFHGADEPLGASVAVRRTRRCPNHADARRGQPLLHRTAPLRIAITEQNASVAEETALTRDLPQTLNHEAFVRIWRAWT
jgi:hypothetical protein